jgi:DNA primase
MLKEAGNETVKRSAVVNHIAETLSKFHRAEDFTKQQDYVRQCAGILKIDEGGLTTLVNKFKRDKITKEENRQNINLTQEAAQPVSPEAEDLSALFAGDEYQERNLLRALLEYGLLQWNEEQTIAEYIFDQLQQYTIDNPQLDNLFNVYKEQYYNGLQPSAKTLLYHDDKLVRELAVALSVQQYELSPNWDTVMEGMKINNRDISKQDVTMSLNYFKLRKIKKMFDENQRDIEKAITFEEQMDLIKIHKVLKEEEQKITGLLGTVIFK